MKILIVNKFYYPRGGDCIYSIGLEKLLLEARHETAFFSMRYPQNVSSQWERYWRKEVSISPRKTRAFLRVLRAPFGDRDTVRRFSALLDDFKPDIVHLNNIHTSISPVVAEIAHKRGIKVVWTLHDFKLNCPAYLFRRSDGTICKDCIGGDKKQVVAHRCIKGSLFGSILGYKEAKAWNRIRIAQCTDCFICPSNFMKKIMVKDGYDESKIRVLHNFLSDLPARGLSVSKESFSYCYVGRLSGEKGIETLIEAAAMLPQYTLYVAGTGPMEAYLREKYGLYAHIRFLGFLNKRDCCLLMKKSQFSVIPSECFENNPLSVIESLCLGTPVLGADIGGIPELIEPGKTGELFKSGDADSLRKGIVKMFASPVSVVASAVRNGFSPQWYVAELEMLYKNILSDERGGVSANSCVWLHAEFGNKAA